MFRAGTPSVMPPARGARPVRAFQLAFLLSVAMAVAFTGCGSAEPRADATARRLPMCGADVSFLPELEGRGAVFSEGGAARDLLDILRDHGVNWIRLRIWAAPSNDWASRARMVALAARAKGKGFSFLLDIHYSDWWADPGRQTKPAAWTGHAGTTLSNDVHAYTVDSVSAFVAGGAAPDMVQVGNEITPGMLWPDGFVGQVSTFQAPVLKGSWNGWSATTAMTLLSNHVWQGVVAAVGAADVFGIQEAAGTGQWWSDADHDWILDTTGGAPANIPVPGAGALVVMFDDATRRYWFPAAAATAPWDRLAMLLKAGAAGVKTAAPAARVMLHLDRGADNTACRAWFDAARARGVPWDVIGLSYYPFWHGKDLAVPGANLADLAARYGTDVCIVETSYPWTLSWADSRNNTVGVAGQLIPAFPATPAGQKAYLAALVDTVRAVPGGRGVGVFWWEPDFVAWTGFPSSQENLAWFDFSMAYNGTADAFLGR